MTPVETIQACVSAGLKLDVREDKLVVSGTGTPPSDVVAALREHRQRILEILLVPREAPPAPPRPAPAPWVPRNRCEFCGRKVLPNLPGASDQWIFVGPVRGQAQVIACMAWNGLKPGKQPCGYAWRKIDVVLRARR